MSYLKQIILYLTLIILSSCTKETKEVETRNIKYLDDRLKAFVPSYHEEYVKFDQRGQVWGGFYYTYFNTIRQDQTCATNCPNIQTYSNYIRLNPSTLISSIFVSSINDTPCLDIRINNNPKYTRIYLNSTMTDIDTTMTKDKNLLAQFSKFPKILIGGKTYENVYFVAYANWTYSFVYSKQYGILQVEDNTLGRLEILK